MSLFAAVVLTWTSYNLVSASTVYTDPRVVGYLDRLIFRTPLDVGIVVVSGFVGYFVLYLAQTGIPFLGIRGVRRSLFSIPRLALQDQRIGCMVLFIIVTVVVSAVVGAAFVLYETFRDLGYPESYLRSSAAVAPLAPIGVAITLRASGQSRTSCAG